MFFLIGIRKSYEVNQFAWTVNKSFMMVTFSTIEQIIPNKSTKSYSDQSHKMVYEHTQVSSYTGDALRHSFFFWFKKKSTSYRNESTLLSSQMIPVAQLESAGVS